MRIPIAVGLESRDGSVTKDAKVLNGLIEVQPGDPPLLKVRKRPGMSDVGQIHNASGQFLYSWNGIQAILGDSLYAGNASTIIGASGTALSPANAGLPFYGSETSPRAATPRLFVHNRTQAWTIKRDGTATAVTFGNSMGATTYNLISLTRSGGTATATLSGSVFQTGDSVVIAGAVQAAYNGTFTVTGYTTGSSTPGADISISSLTRVGTTATAVTATAHGLTNGSSYAISGANQSAYNGTYTVTVTSSTGFTYTVTLSGSGPDNDVSIQSLTRSSTTATATTALAHGLSSGTYTISGADQSEYNGSKSITVTDATHFTYTVTVTPDSPATPATGSPTISEWRTSAVFSIPTTASATCYVTLSSGGSSYFNISNGDTITIPALGLPTDGSHTVTNASASSFEFAVTPGYAFSMDYYFTRTPPSVSSITRSSSTATLTTSAANKIVTGDTLVVSGATQTEYNKTTQVTNTGSTTVTYSVTFTASSPATPATGTIIVVGKTPVTPATGTIIVTRPTVTVNPTFTYTVAGSPTTPATGTITAQGTGGIVPGVAYINGYHVVMDTNGNVNNSASDDPTSWPALSATAAQAVNGAGKGIARSNSNYLLAFKEWSTEFFYDAKNASGSPFSPVEPGFILIGCATGDSIADVDGLTVWMSQVKQLGRSVHMMNGLSATPISTADVERILNADPLTTVYAFGLKLDGHPLYVLTLVASNITLVFDMQSKKWMQWSSLTLGSPVTVSSITWNGDVATVITSTAHGLSDGSPVKIAGANQSQYNGIFPALYLTTTSFQVQVPGSPVTPATGSITATPYTESYFKFIKYANYNGMHLFLHETNGHLYQPSSSLYQDAGIPIKTFGRSVRLDGGTLDQKKMPSLRVIGDSVDDLILIRWSDDDSATFSSFQRIDLSADEPHANKLGLFRRRTLEFQHVGNNPINLSHYEPTISK